MATLKANGDCLAEMKVYKNRTDGADGDEMTCNTVTTYRAMSSGKVLIKHQSEIDYGFGSKSHSGSWAVKGKIKKELITKGKPAVFDAMQSWADQLRAKRFRR